MCTGAPPRPWLTPHIHRERSYRHPRFPEIEPEAQRAQGPVPPPPPRGRSGKAPRPLEGHAWGSARCQAGPVTGKTSIFLSHPNSAVHLVTGRCAKGREAATITGSHAGPRRPRLSPRTQLLQQLPQRLQPQVTQRLLSTAEGHLRPPPAVTSGPLHAVHCGDRQRGGSAGHGAQPRAPRAASQPGRVPVPPPPSGLRLSSPRSC